jgi:hypothetical protein
MRGFDVQLQGSRPRIDNVCGRPFVAALLKSQVVLEADTRQRRQLLATKSWTHRAGNQADILGPNLLAPDSQEITQRVGPHRHHPSLILSLPLPVSIRHTPRQAHALMVDVRPGR